MASLTLTTDGARRLDQLADLFEFQEEQTVGQIMESIRSDASNIAPSPDDEAKILSTSVDGIGSPDPKTPDARGRVRFTKLGSQQYVREAIAQDAVDVEIEGAVGGARIVRAKTGHIQNLNFLVQFSWISTKAGERSSQWTNLIEMWEDGGQGGGIVVKPVFPVTKLFPKDPEPGHRPQFYTQLTKAIPPFQMYRKAEALHHQEAIDRSQTTLEISAKTAGEGQWKVSVR